MRKVISFTWSGSGFDFNIFKSILKNNVPNATAHNVTDGLHGRVTVLCELKDREKTIQFVKGVASHAVLES